MREEQCRGHQPDRAVHDPRMKLSAREQEEVLPGAARLYGDDGKRRQHHDCERQSMRGRPRAREDAECPPGKLDSDAELEDVVDRLLGHPEARNEESGRPQDDRHFTGTDDRQIDRKDAVQTPSAANDEARNGAGEQRVHQDEDCELIARHWGTASARDSRRGLPTLFRTRLRGIPNSTRRL
jgi:hypothetical protein